MTKIVADKGKIGLLWFNALYFGKFFHGFGVGNIMTQSVNGIGGDANPPLRRMLTLSPALDGGFRYRF